MPTASRTDRKKTDKQQAQAYSPIVEFTAAAHEHVEPAIDVTVTPGASAIIQGPFDVPAYGFLRHIFIQVTCSAGTAGAGVLAADAPFNLFQELTLLDVNGAPIFGPMDGYSAYVANLFGGYAFRQDPALAPDYSTGVVTFAFGLRLPVEIQHNNGLGALANQNAAAAYKVRFTVNPSTVIWSTAPTTIPNVRVRGWLEAWSQPTPTDLAGRPQAIAPPRHGTTQYWTKTNRVSVVGDNTIQLPRVGNLLRTLVFLFRDNTGARSAAVPPDPILINWDARQLLREPQFLRRTYMGERYLYSALPAGVFAYSFHHDVLGHGGDGTPELWLPTVQSTRLEVAGANWGAAGSIDILTNDIAPVEVNPSARFAESSASGFHPMGT